jgi:hypothetical protein
VGRNQPAPDDLDPAEDEPGMRRPTGQNKPSPGEARTDPDPSPGLEDPRTIHPSPEEVFPEPGEMPSAEAPESDPTGRDEGTDPGAGDRGIVDPRNETIGPDI